MGKTIMVVTTNPAVALDAAIQKLSAALGANSRTVGLFVPILCDELRSDEIHAMTVSEAKQLLMEGKRGRIIEQVLQKYAEVVKRYEYVLVRGMDHLAEMPVMAFDLNMTVAQNLRAACVLVINGDAQTEATAAKEEIQLALTLMRERFVNPVAVFANGPLTQDQYEMYVESVKEVPFVALGAYGKVTEDNFDASVYRLCAYETSARPPKVFEYDLIERAASHPMRIVLPEGYELRILRATEEIMRRQAAQIILLGDEKEIRALAAAENISLGNVEIHNPLTDPKLDRYAEVYYEARKQKGVDYKKAYATMQDPSYFGTMMVWEDDADGMVSGSVNTTAHTIRPALEFIKTKPGISLVSSSFFMCLKNEVIVFADCAVNPDPTPEQLADIAISTAHTATAFGLKPRIAMLSYSTGTSGKGPDVEAVKEAVRLAHQKAPELELDGPLQFDAAIDPEVAQAKLPNSVVAGHANVFIFPNLNAGNNCYKAVQRLANADAVGPVLQGLKKPVNDLSRGCTITDILNTVAVTAIQALADKS